MVTHFKPCPPVAGEVNLVHTQPRSLKFVRCSKFLHNLRQNHQLYLADAKMDTHIADDKLYTELRVHEKTVQANDRSIENYEIDPVAEKRLLRKLDLRVVPVLWFLFMLAFLDRTNIGTASTQLCSLLFELSNTQL